MHHTKLFIFSSDNKYYFLLKVVLIKAIFKKDFTLLMYTGILGDKKWLIL